MHSKCPFATINILPARHLTFIAVPFMVYCFTERDTSASCHNDENFLDETASENGLLVNTSPNYATQNIAWNEETMQLQYRLVLVVTFSYIY